MRAGPWLAALAGWAAGTLLWTLAAVTGSDQVSPRAILPVAAAQMGVAAVLGLGLWRLSAALPPRPRLRFVLVHLAAIVFFAFSYTSAQLVMFLQDRGPMAALAAALGSPVTGWNLVIGGFIYLAIAGLSYARRAEVRLQESERARQQATLAARDAQLAALHAQLQPHFLFNALHTVGALVHTDPERADRALEQLGQLLRYALREPGHDVTLRQEWEFTRDYLAFESLRLGDRLRLRQDVDQSALDEAVPPFLLQPLVENAVHHGAASRPEGGEVAVVIARQDGVVRLEVSNTSHERASAGMAGSGIRRLHERLGLRYGPAGAEVRATAGDERYVVTVRLPAGFAPAP